MKTAISLPDELYAEAERFARRMRKPRSLVYREALAEYLARHDPDAITEALDRLCATLDTRSDPAVSAAARRMLERSDW